MSRRADKKAQEAKSLEGRLIQEGRHMDAQVIARIRKAAASASATCKMLHDDNMALRQQLGLPSFLDSRAAKERQQHAVLGDPENADPYGAQNHPLK